MYKDQKFIQSEMIILEDSDLYAIINCLKITECYPLYKIWVQEPVIEKFLWLTKKYNNLDLSSSVDTFQSLKDIKLCICNNFSKNLSIVSMWSENIVAAKNFALSLNNHMVFINSYMEFSGGKTFLPLMEIYFLKHLWLENTFNTLCEGKSDMINLTESKNGMNLLNTSETDYLIYHLFYDGTWQKPTQNTYWEHNDILWANATKSDIVRCYQSAKKGFEIWGAKSIKSRIEILSNLKTMLISLGKPLLAAIVERLMNLPHICSSVIGMTCTFAFSQGAEVEVMNSRMPLGVITLKEENENVLFVRLMQTLIVGNTVIVINDGNFCNILPYCEIFSRCGIPAGVINSLSCENIHVLEDILYLGVGFSVYVQKFFEKSTSRISYTSSYEKLTTLKQIVFPLK
ncbi:hypothetical protein P5V15_013444 [Pogonomyrmex californicus]